MSNPYAPPDPSKPRPPRPQPPAGRRPSPPPRPRPEPRQPTPEEVRGVTTSVMLFGALMMGTLLAGSLPIPWQVAAPFVGLLSLWYGFRALLRVRRLQWRGMLTPMLVAGLLLTMMTTMSATTRVTLFWDEQTAYQRCSERAITIAAQERCDREYREAISPGRD
ncbi:MAG TPA: hypothetical protein VKY71_10270 [Actinotalea caeni]|uniref:hypothetical protein n=1 Tax=Actinotalea caeni TaxID=1348467 RepID=UPI002B4B86B3|nr:hypothetical protein [Actinotalea caeni]HLV55942.1 hypothetical protein [Actinotalea caeni]